MNTLTDRLHKVQEQVARLVSEHKTLRDRAAEMETSARDHQRTQEVLTARVTELEKENEVLRKVKSEHEGLVGTGSKERIDELVNEIDRCLALIQN